MADYIVTALQLATSLARLAAFAFAVLTIGKVSDDKGLILAIGYLPYLAFFDILIQSCSRALHLRNTWQLPVGVQFRRVYAVFALIVIGMLLGLSLRYDGARVFFVMISWPLGALGYLWERMIAQRKSQALLAGIELSVIAGGIGFFLLFPQSWSVLLLCIVGFPVARLVALALSADRVSQATAPDDLQEGSAAAPQPRWQMAGYVGSSLAQQFTGATAAALPSIYGQFTGDVSQLAVNVAIFRTLHSLAAVVSMSINAMSTRIFYRQTGNHFEEFEVRLLDFASLIAIFMIVLAALASFYSMAGVMLPVVYAAIIFPAMALVNAESSLLYNRGLPFGTLHCQLMILALSASMLFALVGSRLGVVISMATFVLYMILVMPATVRRHRRILQMSDAA